MLSVSYVYQRNIQLAFNAQNKTVHVVVCLVPFMHLTKGEKSVTRRYKNN